MVESTIQVISSLSFRSQTKIKLHIDNNEITGDWLFVGLVSLAASKFVKLESSELELLQQELA